MGKHRGGKVKRAERLSCDLQLDLLEDLLNGLAALKNSQQVSGFLTGLMSLSQVRSLAKRLGIAKLIFEGKTYESIVITLKVSYATVAKVAAWLSGRGGTLKEVLNRLPKRRQFKRWSSFDSWAKFKKNHPLYFWPELLWEELAESPAKSKRRSLDEVWKKLIARKHRARTLRKDTPKL